MYLQTAVWTAAVYASIRNLNRRNCPQGRLLVSVDLRTDKNSATGGYRFFAMLQLSAKASFSEA